MQVKNIVRKAVVLGSAAGFVGMTIAGALAYDLSTYPAKFIVDGKFDGKIVVGEKASTSDVLGSIDIAASLQGASVSKVAIPGTAGSTTLQGDVFQIGAGSDKLELRESIGNVTDTVTEADLTGLKGGSITTSEGTTEVHQYLRLKDGTSLQNMAVNFAQNDNDKTADFLIVDAGAPFLEWEVQFPDGLESKMSTAPATELKDIQDRTFNIMGTDFNIVKADHLKGSTSASLTLMGGSVPDTLREGETKTYTINGVDYEVTLVFVSDPNQGSAAVKFSVNGEITQSLGAGDTDTLSGGLQIGVRDILVNAREGVASFFLGADKVVFTDSNVGLNDFGGTVEINNKNIQDGSADIQGVESGNNFKITSIKYEVEMDSTSGATAYVEAGHGVREFMKRPQTLVSDTLDLKYAGLTTPVKKDFALKASSDDRYRLTFTNTLGQTYDVPFVSNKVTGGFKYGDDNHDFFFTEGAAIARNDYFVVTFSGVDADRAPTNVLRYTGFDVTSLTASFEDIAGGASVTVPVTNVSGGSLGNLVIGGHTYIVNVTDAAVKDSDVKVDLDGSGLPIGTNPVDITTWGGAVITLGDAGQTLGAATNFNMTYTMAAKNFDTSNAGPETFDWTVEKVTGNKVSLSTGSYAGPLMGTDTENAFAMNDKDSNSDHTVGLTDYGTYIDHYSPSGSNNNADELTLSIPQVQVLAQVYLTMGATTASTGGSAGTADHVNPIAVGIAVLDKDAPAIGSDNLIVVGGPCANTVALELLGSPAKCSEGFEAGKAMIRSWDKDGKVAILVAGYEATETLGASRVLADYKAYSLKGDDVEVVVTSLDSIQVKSATKTA